MRIITLCREYGAGGHSIGRRVAEELGSKRARGRATNGSERLALLAVGKLPVPARDLPAARSHRRVREPTSSRR